MHSLINILFNKYKKHIGSFILMVYLLMINVGNTSITTICSEDIPESIKNLR